MILEMHCHTAEHSECSHVSAADLVQHNFDIDLQVTVLTDHHYLWTPEEIEKLRRKLKVPDYYLILSGQEVTTPELGDVLVYGADVSIDKGTSLEEMRKHFPDAAIIWAHPYRYENIPPRDQLLHPLIDAVEIFSSNHTVSESNRGLRDWHHLKFTAIAGTDTHALSYAELTREKRAKESEVASLLQETVTSKELVQAFAQEEHEKKRFAEESKESLDAALDRVRVSKGFGRTVEVVIAIGTALVVYLGARKALSGYITPGDLIVFISYLRDLYKPVGGVSELIIEIGSSLVCGERVAEILETEIKVADAPDAIDAPLFRGEVVFENVTFGYDSGKPVL